MLSNNLMIQKQLLESTSQSKHLFLDYKTHQCASKAKKYFSLGRTRVWGCDIIVDWAVPQEEPDKETKQTFQQFGKVERAKKIKDYAFVHFDKREEALQAMKNMHGEKDCSAPILTFRWQSPKRIRRKWKKC